MQNLAQVMISFADNGQPFSAMHVSQYSPQDFRMAIQTLMGEDRDALAYALGDAGLAPDLLRQLMEMQGAGATVFTHSMLIRSLRCNLDLAEAFEACGIALAIYPEHPELLKEYEALAEALGLGAVSRV